MENTVGFFKIASIDKENGLLNLDSHDGHDSLTVYLNRRGDLHVEFRPSSLSSWKMVPYVFIFRHDVQVITDLRIDQDVVVVQEHDCSLAKWSTDTKNVEVKFTHF